MKRFNFKEQVRNPMFWISLISIVFAAAGVDFTMLTSWPLLIDAVISVIQNPVAIVAVIGALVGVFNDNTTPGIGTEDRDI